MSSFVSEGWLVQVQERTIMLTPTAPGHENPMKPYNARKQQEEETGIETGAESRSLNSFIFYAPHLLPSLY